LLVSDRSGRFIPRLAKSDFLLWEDNVQQDIANFASEEVAFNVALVLDVSPSVAGSIQDIQDAAIEFVNQLRSQDRVMVISFDRRIHLHCDLTNDRLRLEDSIRSISTGSGTSVYETVYEVVDRRLRAVDGRKALILFSDGEDTTSRRVEYGDAVNIVSESDVLVYGLRYPGVNMGRPRIDPSGGQWPQIQLPWPLPFPWPQQRRRRGPFTSTDPSSGTPSPSPNPGPQWQRRGGDGGDFMADITAAGGGPVYDAQTISDMRGLAAKIAEELRHVYVVSYYPTNALSNGGFRQIRVRVKNRDDIAVRYRRGYTAARDPGRR
jgi:VWFA-related protein